MVSPVPLLLEHRDEHLLCACQKLLWVSAQTVLGGGQGSLYFIDLGLQNM